MPQHADQPHGGAGRGVNVEFSLALNNRTGKFFAGLELIEALGADLLGLYFWRLKAQTPPTGLRARLLGRLMTEEVKLRASSRRLARLAPALRPRRPVIFTDPLQVLLYRLTRQDVVIVHDLGPVTHPAFYADGVDALYTETYKRIVSAGPHLVFVSEASQAEFERLYGSVGGSNVVIYNPVRTSLAAASATPPQDVRPPFVLTVGAVGARKNQAATIEAFERAGLPERGFQYVICGGPEPGFEEVRERARRSPAVRLIGHAPEDDLRWLYRRAEGFILASHLEGFGMPAAEALSAGLLPVISRDSALSEVAGPAALHVQADSVDSIADGLRRLAAMSSEERAGRVERGRAGLSAFAPEAIGAAWRAHLTAQGLLA